ncbi:hypothetical protein RRG08_020147 [Elysia crispata]|uniref:Uncharacterized protein n=1 Tax=Elysia crispata TaxID=231223 RepID=A0AAE0XP26_9GAST|nr:hypothetical protein RRG08_020147 [Elysia crispata]
MGRHSVSTQRDPNGQTQRIHSERPQWADTAYPLRETPMGRHSVSTQRDPNGQTQRIHSERRQTEGDAWPSLKTLHCQHVGDPVILPTRALGQSYARQYKSKDITLPACLSDLVLMLTPATLARLPLADAVCFCYPVLVLGRVKARPCETQELGYLQHPPSIAACLNVQNMCGDNPPETPAMMKRALS